MKQSMLFSMHGDFVMEEWSWQDRQALKHFEFDAMIKTHIEQPDASNSWSQKTIA